jgi:hypothetical protein
MNRSWRAKLSLYSAKTLFGRLVQSKLCDSLFGLNTTIPVRGAYVVCDAGAILFRFECTTSNPCSIR